MKIFLDTEFIEGWKKPIKWLPTIGKLNKPYHSIQLISIGLVSDDGREYYAISNEFNPADSNDWVRENVLRPIYNQLLSKERYAREYHPNLVEPFTDRTLKNLLKWNGRTNYQIANDILLFIYDPDESGLKSWLGLTENYFKHLKLIAKTSDKPEFYAYFSDYDWVLFCSLFGTMMDLPKSFPMYCVDLKQQLDETLERNPMGYKWGDIIGNESKLDYVKRRGDYPKQDNAHNALDDAKWNAKLYQFIQNLNNQ